MQVLCALNPGLELLWVTARAIVSSNSFWSTLKDDLPLDCSFQNKEQARQAVFQSIKNSLQPRQAPQLSRLPITCGLGTTTQPKHAPLPCSVRTLFRGKPNRGKLDKWGKLDKRGTLLRQVPSPRVKLAREI